MVFIGVNISCAEKKEEQKINKATQEENETFSGAQRESGTISEEPNVQYGWRSKEEAQESIGG